MGKSSRKERHTSPIPLKPESMTRIDGDAVFAWARLIAQEEMLAQTKDNLGKQILQERGYPVDGSYILSNDGYIVTRDQALQQMRAQAQGLEDPPHPHEAPAILGSGSQASDPHTDVEASS